MLALHWRHYVNRGPRKMMMGEKKRACEAKRAWNRRRLVDLLDAGAVLRCTGGSRREHRRRARRQGIRRGRHQQRRTASA